MEINSLSKERVVVSCILNEFRHEVGRTVSAEPV